MSNHDQAYLEPYQRALRRHGTEFPSLLWASRQTQRLRFDAMALIHDFTGQRMLDAGCGQADLLDYLLARRMAPANYVGIEAMDEHIAEARRKSHPDCLIVKGDFVREPRRFLAGADVIVFCGSLNTLSDEEFHSTLRHASAAARTVVFNFLCSARLAAADWLTWHATDDVLRFLKEVGGEAEVIDDYLDGDCTIAIHTQRSSPLPPSQASERTD